MPHATEFDQRDVPRSTTELFPEALNLSPKQRMVLNVVQSFAQGAKATEVADVLQMHVNTARGHLDELVAKGAARVTSAPATGRGRPSLIYSVRVPKGETIAQEYVSLIAVLASLADAASTGSGESAGPAAADAASLAKARAIGAQWARTNLASFRATSGKQEEFLATLLRLARDMGFDPTMAPDCITLNACPFVTENILPTPFICAMHAGFLTEASILGCQEPVRLRLTPLREPRICTIDVLPEPEEPAAEPEN